MSERIDIRLSEEDKLRLAELAKEKGISMTDLVRVWITRADVVHVLAEQLQDVSNDFAKWHVLENRNTSVRLLCEHLRNSIGSNVENWKRVALYRWIELFGNSFELMVNDVSDFKDRVAGFLKQPEPKQKNVLVELTNAFKEIVTLYNTVFIEGFLNILQSMGQDSKEYCGQMYNDEVRTRYNEITSKYEDFLKRAQRELGESLEQAMPRAREYRRKEEA